MRSKRRENDGQLMYRCRVFDVREGEFSLPDGRNVRQSWIDHKPCIAVIPMTSDGRLLLIRQYRHATGQVLTEIPAGAMDRGAESVEECVQRELAEETGFQAGRLVKLFEGYLIPGYGNEYMCFFLALDLFPFHLPADEDEFIETITVSFDEAREMIHAARIVDVKTALGIVMAESWMKRNEFP